MPKILRITKHFLCKDFGVSNFWAFLRTLRPLAATLNVAAKIFKKNCTLVLSTYLAMCERFESESNRISGNLTRFEHQRRLSKTNDSKVQRQSFPSPNQLPATTFFLPILAPFLLVSCSFHLFSSY